MRMDQVRVKIMNERVLQAYINGLPIGTLHEANGLWGFQYSRAWLENPNRYALSPQLPFTPNLVMDGATQRPVQWYFDNLLPEEGQRSLLAADAEIDRADAFGLLAYYGAESAGSLTLVPPDAPAQLPEPLRPLPDEALQARIRQLPRAPLTHSAVKRMSLAGAQHKLAVVLQDDRLFEPAGATPSTHILKPDHPDEDYPHSVVNEWFVMRLAHQLKLAVPPVYRRYVPLPVYLIERFDRVLTPQGWARTHVIDACQLLGLDRTFKYSQGSMQSLAALANACRSPAVVRTQLFSWMVFNVLVGNADAHLKNLSFRVSDDGVQLAPFYDLLSTAVYETLAFERSGWPEQTQLAWPILGVQRFSEINKAVLIEAGAVLGLAKSTAERLLTRLRTQIGEQAHLLYEHIQTENQGLLAHRPQLAATLAGELRCLRAILHLIIQEMVRRTA